MQPPPVAAAPAAAAPADPGRASRIAYQPALDGLWALAILTIVLYHGQASWPRGGYLSVDLFFVLSGYLITSLPLAEWDARASIDLKRFWSGRARRLLPALFLMLGGVAACAALLAPAPDVTLMVLGGWEVLDHQVDGRVLETATPECEQDLDGELQLADDLVAPSSRRVAMLNVPCYHQPDTGLDKSLAATRNDPSRGQWLNQVLGSFVAAHRDRMALLDLRSFLCPAGRYLDRAAG